MGGLPSLDTLQLHLKTGVDTSEEEGAFLHGVTLSLSTVTPYSKPTVLPCSTEPPTPFLLQTHPSL